MSKRVITSVGGGQPLDADLTALAAAPLSPSIAFHNGTSASWLSPFAVMQRDHFIGFAGGDWAAAASGTGAGSAVTTGTAANPGLWELSTGTTTTGSAAFRSNNSEILFGALTWELLMRVRVTTLSDGTETYAAHFGFGDSSIAEPTDGAYFIHNSASGNWSAKTSNNGVRTTASGGSPVAVTPGSFQDLRIVVNAAGTSVTFYVFSAGVWVSIGSSSTNIPTGAGREFGRIGNIVKSAGTTARLVTADAYTVIGY